MWLFKVVWGGIRETYYYFKLFIYLLLSFKDNSVESNYHSVFMNGRTLLILHFTSSNKINTQDQ